MKYTFSTAAAAALLAAQASAQDVCTAPGVVVEPTAVEYPLYISTYVADATVLNINNNINITINNAPTTIEMMTTATSTVFNTVTATTTTTAAPAPTATTIDEPIILGINNGLARKRQSAFAGFLGASGSVAPTCQEASTLTLNAGELFLASGAGQFSTSSGMNTSMFSPSAAVGSITTTFGLSAGFVWVNSAFVGGEAIFYVSALGSIEASFSGAIPVGGTAIGFTAILASSCPGANTTSASGSPSITPSANATLATSIPSSLTTSSSLSFTSSTNLTTTATSIPSSIVSPTSVSPTSVTPTTSVSLAFASPTASAAGAKRQATTLEYVQADGTFTNVAADAAVYLIVDGELFVDGAQISTNTGTPYDIFSPLATVGDITTTFDSSAGSLSWTNSSFSINSAGLAEFAVSSGTVYAAYATIPPGATQIVLSAIPATTSAAATTSSSSSISIPSITAPSSTSSSMTSSVSGLPTPGLNDTGVLPSARRLLAPRLE